MTTNFRRSLKTLNKYLIKAKKSNIFHRESEIPSLKETIMLIQKILKKHYCLAIVPQAIRIGEENKIYNEKEKKEIKKILKNTRIFDNIFTDKLLKINRSSSYP